MAAGFYPPDQFHGFSLPGIVNDLDAFKVLQSAGVLHASRQCKVGHPMKVNYHRSRLRWRCYRKGCRKQCSVRKGTFLENTRVSLSKFLTYLFFWTNEVGQAQAAYFVGLSHKTVADIRSRLREICQFANEREPELGPGRVQADESWFKGSYKTWVLAAISQRTRHVRAKRVPNRKGRGTLYPILRKWIGSEATLLTDGATCYKSVNQVCKWIHITCNHSIGEWVEETTGATVNSVENFWSICKHRWDGRDLDLFLAEQVWRYNLKSDGIPTYMVASLILKEITRQHPPT